MSTNLNKGEAGLFDALNDDGTDSSWCHKVELGQLLSTVMVIMMVMVMVIVMVMVMVIVCFFFLFENLWKGGVVLKARGKDSDEGGDVGEEGETEGGTILKSHLLLFSPPLT